MRLQECREYVAAARSFLDRCKIARAGDPDRRVRLLVGPRPKIDRAAAREAAFEIERFLVAGPSLYRQVDALPQPFNGLRRVGVCGKDFVGHPTHETYV